MTLATVSFSTSKASKKRASFDKTGKLQANQPNPTYYIHTYIHTYIHIDSLHLLLLLLGFSDLHSPLGGEREEKERSNAAARSVAFFPPLTAIKGETVFPSRENAFSPLQCLKRTDTHTHVKTKMRLVAQKNGKSASFSETVIYCWLHTGRCCSKQHPHEFGFFCVVGV